MTVEVKNPVLPDRPEVSGCVKEATDSTHGGKYEYYLKLPSGMRACTRSVGA